MLALDGSDQRVKQSNDLRAGSSRGQREKRFHIIIDHSAAHVGAGPAAGCVPDALPYSVTAARAERLLLGAVSQVAECAAIPRENSIVVVEYTDSGILWRLRFWCPDGRREFWRFKVHESVQRSLFYASVSVPAPILNIQRRDSWPHEAEHIPASSKLLHNLPLFASLTEQEHQFLLAHAPTLLCPAGAPVLRQGDAGDSLFVAQEGALAMYVKNGAGDDQQVGQLGPGQFFGERSLLMGEPRGATVIPQVDTVVVEIGRAAIAPLLQERPALMEFLSKVLAERDAANDAVLKARNDQSAIAQPTLAAHILGQTRSLFAIQDAAGGK